MTSNAVVQTLPTEIWRRITELACVDGGRTGVSLAMSCKYLRAQTFAGRFHTLTLHSLIQLESFLICVDSLKETSDLRILRVRHLWLSFLHETAIPIIETSVEEPNISKPEWEARVLTTLRPLLPLIAPTLLTLVVAQRVSWPLPPSALAFSFPQLTELTFLNGPTDGPPTSDRASTAHWPFDLARRPFPALRRLHVIGDHPHARRALLATPAHAPTLCQLTHLRFSGIYHGDYLRSFVKQPLAPVLARALGVSPATLTRDPTSSSPPGADDPATSTPRADAAPSRPPLARLRHLILHGVEPASGRSSFSLTGWDDVMSALAEVALQWDPHARVPRRASGLGAKTGPSSKRHAVVLDREWRSNFKWEARVWDDWVARIEGRRGCWVDDEDEEAALEGPRNPEDDEVICIFDFDD